MSNTFLTGPPGIGKTTVVKQMAALLGKRAAGFYTEEIRDPGTRERIGFVLVTCSGRRSILAHRKFQGPFRVGPYGVAVGSFEKIGVKELLDLLAGLGEIALVDEIGKMECCSQAFQRAVRRLLDSPLPVVATVTQGVVPFARECLDRPDAEVIAVTRENRDKLSEELAARLGK